VIGVQKRDGGLGTVEKKMGKVVKKGGWERWKRGSVESDGKKSDWEKAKRFAGGEGPARRQKRTSKKNFLFFGGKGTWWGTNTHEKKTLGKEKSDIHI